MSEDIEKIRKELFSYTKDNYGEKYQDHLLEEYKLYIQMMDNNSARRANANTFFLTINSAIVAIMGIITKLAGCPMFINILWIILSAIFGIILCYRWEDIINSYSDLNAGKFQIIHLLEERLPAKLYKAEWDYLRPEEREKKYTQMTVTEKRVIRMFRALYIILIIIGLVSYFFSDELHKLFIQIMSEFG